MSIKYFFAILAFYISPRGQDCGDLSFPNPEYHDIVFSGCVAKGKGNIILGGCFFFQRTA